MSASKVSWRIDIFVLDKRTMVITNMCSSSLSVSLSNLCVHTYNVCLSPQNGVILATFLAPSTTFPGELANGSLIGLIPQALTVTCLYLISVAFPVQEVSLVTLLTLVKYYCTSRCSERSHVQSGVCCCFITCKLPQ